ncbi:RND transporter [Salibaculum halophilum]|uniref:RND transporter n=1 Tax=Salibaculum halophilum TaxID=1914408 RepID=UPI000A11B360|nr:RND transporter [Salibaculum halophilum]
MAVLDQIDWSLILLACATLGLAPFVPEPHIWEKLKMLVAGELTKPLDILDFLMHGAPFLVLAAKVVREATTAV